VKTIELQHADASLLSHLSGRLDVFKARRQEEYERPVMLTKKP
jgi:hypothetical protein